MRALLLLAGFMAGMAQAKQPTSPDPQPAPMRPLHWGQLNILATTDTHGWHAGHLQEASYSADWGDYISFASHMRRIADSQDLDLLLVDTGDRVDGNGLYDGSDPKGVYTSEIFKQQNVDLLCSGNHELYRHEAAETEYNTTVPDFRDKYLASNLDIAHPETGKRTQMSRRYKVFTTAKQNLRILSMGFLFDFTGGAKNVFVTPVEETVKTAWFQEAIKEQDIDVFIIIGHVAPRSLEWKTVYTEIRKRHWDTPILFFSGHSHVRDFVQLDSKAVALQSGRYLETIGFLSISGIVKEDLAAKFEARAAIEERNHKLPWFLPSPFRAYLKAPILPELTDEEEELEAEWARGIRINRRYIDSNQLGYQHHTGTNASTFPTKHGLNVSSTIAAARKTLDLDKTYGCAPQTYFVNLAPYPHEDSLFTLMVDKLLPSVLDEYKHGSAQTFISNNPSRPKIALMNTGGLRFDVFKGAFTRDTVYIVSPFENRWRVIRNVPWGIAKHVLPLINSGGEVLPKGAKLNVGAVSLSKKEEKLMNEVWRLAPPEQMSWKEERVYPAPHALGQYTKAWKLLHEQKQKLMGTSTSEDESEVELTPGYTTTDDLDSNGDDAVHSPLNYYRVPNAIQANVGWGGKEKLSDEDNVDVVFLDFVQPWIVIALRYLGHKVSDAPGGGDVESYLEGKGFTTMIKEWVGENWGENCESG